MIKILHAQQQQTQSIPRVKRENEKVHDDKKEAKQKEKKSKRSNQQPKCNTKPNWNRMPAIFQFLPDLQSIKQTRILFEPGRANSACITIVQNYQITVKPRQSFRHGEVTD